MHLFHRPWWTIWKWFLHNIRKLIKVDEFFDSWTSFVDVVKNFFGNRRTESYKNLVEKLLKSLQGIGVNMGMKVHFLLSYLDKFLDKYGDVSDELVERFHQNIQTMEQRYKGR